MKKILKESTYCATCAKFVPTKDLAAHRAAKAHIRKLAGR